MTNTELILLQYCKTLIEEELAWISSQKWKQRDYLQLIDLIEDKTGVSLSLSTIKRIWKKDVNGIPQMATLDALAKFLDYENWMEFKKSNRKVISNESHLPVHRLPVRKLLLPAAGIVVVCSIIVLIKIVDPQSEKKTLTYNPDVVAFSSHLSSMVGVPNTVIFHYHVDQVEADSFFIQQSWDEQQREPVQKTETDFTSIYYFPGVHKAKLIANDSVIKQTDVQIFTDGWLAMVRNGYMDQFPTYIRNFERGINGELQVTMNDLNKYQVSVNQNTILSYYFVNELDSLSSNAYFFKTKVKCDSIYNFICPHITISILGENDMNYFPLISRGCVGYANVKMGDVVKTGRDNDLSRFGVDIYKWQEVELEVINNVATILLNGEHVLVLPFNKDIGRIVGFNLNFSGIGTIDYVTLEDESGNLLYNTEFDSYKEQ